MVGRSMRMRFDVVSFILGDLDWCGFANSASDFWGFSVGLAGEREKGRGV